MAKGNFIFGAGSMITIPNEANPTPIPVGTPQGADLSFSGNTATVFGNKRFAVATAGTTIEVTGTINLGEGQFELVSKYLFGATKSVGFTTQHNEKVLLTDSSGTVEYVADDFNKDMGVVSTAGIVYTRVDSSATPIAKQYKVDEDTGTYTFAASEAGNSVIIRFNSVETNEGDTYTLNNTEMGETPSFVFQLTGKFQGKKYLITLNNCTATSFSLSTSNDGFATPSFEFSASVDDNDVLGTFQYLG